MTMTLREVIKLLEDNGFILDRHIGKHIVYTKPNTKSNISLSKTLLNKSVSKGLISKIKRIIKDG